MAVSLLAALLLPGVPIDWDAPAGCPDAAQLRERIGAQPDLSEDASVDLEVAGSIRSKPSGGFVLEVETYGSDTVDRRVLEGDSCEALTDAAALIVALRMTAEAEAVPEVVPEVEPAVEPTTEPTEVEPKVLRPPPPPATVAPIEPAPRRERPELGAFVGVAGGLALGVLPTVGGAVRFEGGLEGRHYRVGLTARGVPVRRVDHPDASDVAGRLDLVGGGALGCGVPLAGNFAFPLCARLLVGGVRATGDRGVDVARPQWSAWVGGSASAAASWRPLRLLAVFVELEGVAGFARPGFTIGTAPGTLYKLRIPGFRAWMGIELRPQFGARKPTSAQTQH